METLTRVDDLLRSANPNAVAIIYEDKLYRYRDLYEGMIKVAGNLLEHNLYTDKIIVLLGNRPEAIMAIMGISYIGGTFIPLPSTIKSHRLEEIIKDSGATAIITDDRFEPIVNAISNTSTLRAALDIDMLPVLTDFVGRSKPAYPAALMYTSGTTGKPKGVICPHEKIMAATSSINAYMLHTNKDVVATALPLSHGYGLYQVFTLLEAGGTVLLENNFSYPERTLERIRERRATGFAAVPSMIHMIQQIDGWEKYFDNVSYITTAGAALPPSTFQKLKDTLPMVNIIPMYGQTECVRTLYYSASYQRINKTRFDSCGKTIPDTETKLLYKTESDGELLIKNPHVMDGYWNNPEETERTFKNGWLHTGDLFRIDSETGLHFFIGRNDDVIKIKGERCAPVELDNALMLIPKVYEAVAFAVKDNLWGYRFVVYVSSVYGWKVTKNDVMRFCKKNLEAYFMPKDVVIVDIIPKNDNGKISRVLLKELYENEE